MAKKSKKYTRCKKCRELVLDADNCANCENRDPLSLSGRRRVGSGKRGMPTLDIQERNIESHPIDPSGFCDYVLIAEPSQNTLEAA